MSDPIDRRVTPTWRGGAPSQSSSDVGPPESAVTGSIEVPREAAAYEVGGINVDQLALALAERLRPAEVERPMLGELAESWFESIKGKRVAPGNERGLLEHLKPLYLDDESTLTVAAVRELLERMLEAGYSPTTVNKVRGAGKHVVEFAQARKVWSGPNPFALARRLREPQRQYELLTLAELARVQEHLAPPRRREMRVCLHLGLRPGELFALQRDDLDLEAGTLRIHRSHGRDQTKTGTERTVPVHPACAGDLLEASLVSTSALLFPDESGQRQRFDTKLTRALRTAMGKAGVGIDAVVYKCRRRGCEADDVRVSTDVVTPRDCAACGMRLWPVPEVRPVRWYDLRHICATLHHQHRADPTIVARALGHSISGTTQRIYTHPSMDDARRELTKWRLP